MTQQTQSATILKFPTPLLMDNAMLGHMAEAEAHAAHVSHLIEIEAANVRAGANLSIRGGILGGRAIHQACRLISYLIALRGNRKSDRALATAVRSWCNDWKANE
jgi:hypothetical protein